MCLLPPPAHHQAHPRGGGGASVTNCILSRKNFKELDTWTHNEICTGVFCFRCRDENNHVVTECLKSFSNSIVILVIQSLPLGSKAGPTAIIHQLDASRQQGEGVWPG